MPRSRAVTPDHFTSKRGQVSAEAWKLLQAMECHADDAGLHPLDPAQLRAEAFPHHVTVTAEATRALIIELVDADLFVPYFGPDRKPYIFSRTFHEDQKPQNPSQARYPLPPFVAEKKEDKPGRTIYHYHPDPTALADYREGPGKGAVRYVYRTYRGQLGLYDGETASGTCSGQPVPYMYDVGKGSEGKEREEGLDLPPSTVPGAPASPRQAKSSPSLSLISNDKSTTPTLPACLTGPTSLLLAAQVGLVALAGHELDAPTLSSLTTTFSALCSRRCLVHAQSPSDKVAKYLPICHDILAAALVAMPHPSTMEDPPAELARLFEARRVDFIDEVLAVDGVDKEAGNP